jgi:hypothetical protein
MTDPIGDNPYASPTTDVTLASRAPEGSTAAERLRRKYLKHEATVRSIGTLQYFGAGVLVFAALAIVLEEVPARQTLFGVSMAVFCIAFAVGICFLARGLRRLEPWARITAIVLLALNFPAAIYSQHFNPVALGFVAVILYWLLNEKGRMVFSAEYRQAVAATPHITYRTARWVWIALAVILGLIAIAVIVGSVRR